MFERVPHVFGNDLDAYITWKHQLGVLINVDPRAILLVGTAAVGTSLNPHKNFKAFDKNSDIDVAIVSAHHFDIIWRWFRNLGADYHRLPTDAKEAVDLHRDHYLYWGVIATDKVLHHTPLAQRWVQALEQMSKCKPTIGREIKARLYIDFDALRAYHVNGIGQIQKIALSR
jgi:hypothetical protein